MCTHTHAHNILLFLCNLPVLITNKCYMYLKPVAVWIYYKLRQSLCIRQLTNRSSRVFLYFKTTCACRRHVEGHAVLHCRHHGPQQTQSDHHCLVCLAIHMLGAGTDNMYTTSMHSHTFPQLFYWSVRGWHTFSILYLVGWQMSTLHDTSL